MARQAIANGYRNWKYGTHQTPASKMGIVAAVLCPRIRGQLDAGIRHLRQPMKGDRLLDVGCGNGAFLALANDIGWNTVGIEVDAEAATKAKRMGNDVRIGKIDEVSLASSSFTLVTVSHVIEHVHWPVQVLLKCYDLMKPGGELWLETPNIESYGHKIFGRYWRGLEPPRHLVVFSLDGLFLALKSAGFEDIVVRPLQPRFDWMFDRSAAIEAGADPYGSFHVPVKRRLQFVFSEWKARRKPNRREFLTVTARKPTLDA